MRIIETDCEVNYDGRGSTSHGRAVRVLIIKNDRSFLIHADKGVKPMNYMTNVKEISEDTDPDGTAVLTVTSKKNEIIDVIMYRKMLDMVIDVPEDDSNSMVNGTERQLQEWLTRPDVFKPTFGDNKEFIMRELKVDTGSIDIFGFDCESNRAMIIEVKRKAMKNDVYQIVRYRDSIQKAALTMDSSISDQIDAAARLIPQEEQSRLDAVGRLSFSTMANPECYLIAESGHGPVAEACSEHDIEFITCGSSWRGHTEDNAKASKTSLKRHK